MSFKNPNPSTTEQAKFDELNAQGILSITAAGNDGDTSFSYPASYSSVISVAAIDSSKVVASFSQRNNQVDIAAPGVGISSTIPGGYASWQGTSMATPHVSAVAALIWSAKPSATNEQVRTALINTAEDLGVIGRDDLYGYGLVRAKQALDYLITSSSSPTSTPAPTTIGLSRRVYTSGTHTGSYYNLGANRIIYTNCFTAVAAGEEKLLLKEAIVGIFRVASAGGFWQPFNLLVDVGIKIYAAELSINNYGAYTSSSGFIFGYQFTNST
jgi:subtilisin family serine protease